MTRKNKAVICCCCCTTFLSVRSVSVLVAKSKNLSSSFFSFAGVLDLVLVIVFKIYIKNIFLTLIYFNNIYIYIYIYINLKKF